MPLCQDCRDRIDTLARRAAKDSGKFSVTWDCSDCGRHVVRVSDDESTSSKAIEGVGCLVALVLVMLFLLLLNGTLKLP